MKRIVLSFVLALAGTLSLGAVAYAGTVTETNNIHKGTDTFQDVLTACVGGAPTHTITITYNAVEHITILENGSFHATFTQTGKFTAIPIVLGGESFAGSFTLWGGFNGNINGATTSTFTFSVRGKGDQGTRLNTSIVDHVTVTPNGLVHEFSHCR